LSVQAPLQTQVVLGIVQVFSQSLLVQVTEVVQPEEVNRLNRSAQFDSSTLAESLLIAGSQMRDHVMLCGVLAVLASERSQHALDCHARRVHGEQVAFEPLELIGIPHAPKGIFATSASFRSGGREPSAATPTGPEVTVQDMRHLPHFASNTPLR